VRFDGIRFVPWSPRNGKLLPSSVIVSLLAAQDGSLWIGTSLGLSHWVDEDIFNYSQAPGAITAIVQGDDGRIWFLAESTTNGICVVADLGARCYGKADGVSLDAGGPLVEDALETSGRAT
jgi:ligand-binding sensor domain-containing protein